MTAITAMTSLALSHVPAGSPGWVYTVVFFGVLLHITGGALAIPAGFVAVTAKKGDRLHRRAGTVFLAAMLAMGGMGAFVGTLLHQNANIGTGTLVVYLVATAWMTVRRPEGETGLFEKAALVAVTAVAAAYLSWGVRGSLAPNGMFDGFGASLYYVFGAVAALLAVTDFRVLAQGGVRGEQRIARHLWRMCLAFFIATASFFLGQQKVMPAAWHGAKIWWVLALAPLPIMVFWLIRVRFKPWRSAVQA